MTAGEGGRATWPGSRRDPGERTLLPHSGHIRRRRVDRTRVKILLCYCTILQNVAGGGAWGRSASAFTRLLEKPAKLKGSLPPSQEEEWLRLVFGAPPVCQALHWGLGHGARRGCLCRVPAWSSTEGPVGMQRDSGNRAHVCPSCVTGGLPEPASLGRVNGAQRWRKSTADGGHRWCKGPGAANV